MKKLLILTLALCLCFVVFAGCQETETPTETSGTEGTTEVDAAETTEVDTTETAVEKEDYTIGFSCDDLSTDFAANLSAGVAVKCNELGLELVIRDGAKDAQLQSTQIENMITDGCDAIVIKPYDISAMGVASAACENAGVPLVVVTSPLETYYTAMVGADPAENGVIKAKAVIEAAGENAKVAMVLGPLAMQMFVDMNTASNEHFAQYPGIEVVDEQTGNCKRDESLRLVENWLGSGMEFDAIICANDASALGAAQACAEAGIKDEVFIIGNGGAMEGLTAVKDGTLDATIFMPGYAFGVSGVETAYKLIKGETLETVEVMLEQILVTQENVDEFIEIMEAAS